MKSGVTVADVMSLKPVSIKLDKSASECAKLMLKKKVGSLLVVKDHLLKGIITEKDLVSKIVAKNKDAKKIKAKDIMTKRIISASPNLDLLKAVKIMKKKNIRRLPIIAKDKRLIGMLTINDVIKIQPHLYDYYREKQKLNFFKKIHRSRKRYIEGECENCGSYAQLYEYDGQLLCEECRDEIAGTSEKEAETG